MKRFLFALLACSCVFGASAATGNDVPRMQSHEKPTYSGFSLSQSDDALSRSMIDWNTERTGYTAGIGYSFQTAYPIGFHVLGLSFGFKSKDIRYTISDSETRIPKWAIHNLHMWQFGTMAFRFQGGLRYGLNIAETETQKNGISSTKRKPYFGVGPVIGVGFYFFNIFAGYEWVINFSDINGMFFGVGFNL